MADFWFVDSDRKACGPIAPEEFRKLIANGSVTPQTLVWMKDAPEWVPAARMEALKDAFAPPDSPATGPLQSKATTWGLFWRLLVVILGQILIIPAPWASTAFWKYIGQTTQCADGRRFTFEGKAGDIWPVFVVPALMLWFFDPRLLALAKLPLAPVIAIQVLKLIVGVVLPFVTIRWFVSKLRIGDGAGSLSFKGGFWVYLAWQLAILIAFMTLVFGPLAYRNYMRWLCRKTGGAHGFVFTGSAWGIFWRGLAVMLLCLLVIPIPWAGAWFIRWLISQISMVDRSAAA